MKDKKCISKHQLSCLRAHIKKITVSVAAFSLSGCLMDGTPSWSDSSYMNDNYFMMESTSHYEYSDGYNSSNDAYLSLPDTDTGPAVIVPNSYHLNNFTNNPTPSKDEDRQWVDNQNPSAYTIEVSKDAKPAPVANKLQQMPKNEHSVEVRSKSGSYIGLHGSYPNREAAEQQMNNLPPSVKDNAKIKNWQSIQTEVD